MDLSGHVISAFSQPRTALFLTLPSLLSSLSAINLSDVFSEVDRTDRRKKKGKKRVVLRPPMVDSALLRFLSKQKQLKDQQTNSSDATSPSAIPGENNQETRQQQQPRAKKAGNYLINAIEQQRAALFRNQLKGVKQQPTDATTDLDSVDTTDTAVATSITPPSSPNSDLPPPPEAEDALDSWTGQFNRNRIAQVLQSRGGDAVATELANQAGESVQQHVLARTARRRVRDFLKARDTMWSEGMISDLEIGDIPEKNPAYAAKEPDYGFADVVDVLMDNGLTAKDIATILIHTPSIAVMMPLRPENSVEGDALGGETVEETLQRALSDILCGSLKLRRYDARKVLRNCPGLLTKRGSRSAQHVVATMVKLGVSTSSIARDKNALPTLLSRPPAALFRLIAFLSSDAIRMPLDKIGPLIRRAECAELLEAVAPVPRLQQWNEATGTASYSPSSLQDESNSEITDDRILPAFVERTVEERRKDVEETYRRMSATAWTLRNELGTCDLGKVVAAYPNVLLLDASDQVLPVASYLMDELGIFKDDLARVLQLFPTLLGMPISEMEDVVALLLDQGVEEDNLPSMFRSFPYILTLNIEKDMLPVIGFLQDIGISNVGRFISRLPPILGYSVEKELKPKWEVIRNVYTYSSFELSKFPAFFSYPLERVIKSRFEYLRDVKKLPISLIAPDLVLRYGDRDFAVRVAGDGDGGAGFSEFLKARQGQSGNNHKKRPKRKPKTPARQKQRVQQ